jgi:hypothetical protein
VEYANPRIQRDLQVKTTRNKLEKSLSQFQYFLITINLCPLKYFKKNMDFSKFMCSFSNESQKHLIKDALALPCGFYVCSDCLNRKSSTFNCKKCNNQHSSNEITRNSSLDTDLNRTIKLAKVNLKSKIAGLKSEYKFDEIFIVFQSSFLKYILKDKNLTLTKNLETDIENHASLLKKEIENAKDFLIEKCRSENKNLDDEMTNQLENKIDNITFDKSYDCVTKIEKIELSLKEIEAKPKMVFITTPWDSQRNVIGQLKLENSRSKIFFISHL